MVHGFSLEQRHEVRMASFGIYKQPILHPTRVLPEHDFVYILEGEWTIGQAGEVYRAKKDDVILLGAGVYHWGVEPCLPGTRTMYLHVAASPGDGVMEADIPMDCNGLCMDSWIYAGGNTQIRTLFEAVIRTTAEGQSVCASAYLDLLLYELSSMTTGTESNELAEAIHDLIVSAPDRILKNSEIASALHVSTKTAETAFRKAYESSIHQYVLRWKIEQAKGYLREFPAMKLSEIAINLGFFDEYHLSRCFKRISGQTPSEYRQYFHHGMI